MAHSLRCVQILAVVTLVLLLTCLYSRAVSWLLGVVKLVLLLTCLYSRAVSWLLAVVKLVLLLTCLYFFICSLSFLSDSFRILGGKNIGGKSN